LLATGDSVRATVSVLDVETGRTIAQVEHRDVADRIDRLSDSLAASVLRKLQRTRRIDAGIARVK